MGIREYLEKKKKERELHRDENFRRQQERRVERSDFKERMRVEKEKAYKKAREERGLRHARESGKAAATPVGERIIHAVAPVARQTYRGLAKRPRGPSGRFRRARTASRGSSPRQSNEAVYEPFAGGDVGGIAFGGSFISQGEPKKKRKGSGMGMFGGNI
jgi:hypothetical protein